jgi:hypothetical protein
MSNDNLLRILRTVLDTRVFDDDDEFQTVLGYERSEYQQLLELAESSATVMSLDGESRTMMESAIAQLVGYPHQQKERVAASIGFPIDTPDAYQRLRGIISLYVNSPNAGDPMLN